MVASHLMTERNVNVVVALLYLRETAWLSFVAWRRTTIHAEHKGMNVCRASFAFGVALQVLFRNVCKSRRVWPVAGNPTLQRRGRQGKPATSSA